MIQPTKGRVLIKKLKQEDVKTDGGIHVPGSALREESLYFGEVVSKGHPDFKKGTKVYYSRYSSTRVSDEKGDPFYILSDLDIMATDETS